MALLLGAAGVSAQDTVVSIVPKATYFYSHWVDSGRVRTTNLPQNTDGRLTGKYCYSQDTLTVYGIAASLCTYTSEQVSHCPLMQDTTMDNVWEYMGLLKPVADTLQWVSDSLYVHLRDTPVSYYYDINLPSIFHYQNTPQVVYELYFKEPFLMVDSFYVGITQQSWRREFDDSLGYYIGPELQRPVLVTGYKPFSPTGEELPVHGQVVHKIVWGNQVEYGYRSDHILGSPLYCYPFMFPILAPQDTTIVDTTIVDTTIVDTTGIVSPQLLERYINVVPNPATDKAQVLSSFGLREVEVYDAAGARVLLRRRLTGYTADLDLAALPAGAYLVRVITPSGSVTKKLIVQRR